MFTPRSFSPAFWRVSALFMLSLAVLVSGGCSLGSSKPPQYFLQFFLEAAPGGGGTPFTMPESKLEYSRVGGAFLNGADITSVNEGTVEVSGVRQLCVIFTFSTMAQRDLTIATANNVGRRIFLFANDKPMGVRPIDQVIQSNQLFMFIEVPEPYQKNLEKFVADVQDSQKRIEEMKKK